MRKIKLYQVDAFTDKLFSGNPAAVCILDSWLDDALMQSIANENNLSETAFVVPNKEVFAIRWFTPTIEVELCGHATLASSFVIFNILNYQNDIIKFHSPISGDLFVEKKGDMLFLDFPTDNIKTVAQEQYSFIEKCVKTKVIALFKGNVDYVAVVENEATLKTLEPDLTEISKLHSRGLIVTAKGDEVDFVSRYFGPQCGIDEDPVTGSAHTTLLRIWSKKLDKNRLIAKQLSKRGGDLECEFKNDRCIIGGKARLYLTGEIYLN
jgi:PhzF family phenazine biosynthesis protein